MYKAPVILVRYYSNLNFSTEFKKSSIPWRTAQSKPNCFRRTNRHD